MFAVDIKSLYTVIPNSEGLKSFSQFLDKRDIKVTPTNMFGRKRHKRLVELVLTLNMFFFNGKILQT